MVVVAAVAVSHGICHCNWSLFFCQGSKTFSPRIGTSCRDAQVYVLQECVSILYTCHYDTFNR